MKFWRKAALLTGLVCVALARADSPTMLNGAGATFPYPVYAKWFESYHKSVPEVDFHYDAIGSEAGVEKLKQAQVDFAASDVKISADQYFAGGKPKYLRFPTVLGAVVPVYRLSEVPRDLRFSPEALAGIYLGVIRRWNDPAIRATNRGVALPNREIQVVHRSDGSGTSYVWTDYLSQISSMWRSSVGTDSSPKWPFGKGAAGNEGVAAMVSETEGAIGYVEYIYAITKHLSYGSVRNKAGKFISPDLESIAAAAEGSSSRVAEDFQTSLVNAPGANAYPVTCFSWFIVPAEISDPAKKKALKDFLGWMLGPGQKQAAALGYVAISHDLLERERRALERF